MFNIYCWCFFVLFSFFFFLSSILRFCWLYIYSWWFYLFFCCFFGSIFCLIFADYKNKPYLSKKIIKYLLWNYWKIYPFDLIFIQDGHQYKKQKMFKLTKLVLFQVRICVKFVCKSMNRSWSSVKTIMKCTRPNTWFLAHFA